MSLKKRWQWRKVGKKIDNRKGAVLIRGMCDARVSRIKSTEDSIERPKLNKVSEYSLVRDRPMNDKKKW